MNIIRESLLVLLVVDFLACSDFYAGAVSHGDPKIALDTIRDTVPIDTIRDTLVIPSDSLVLPTRFAINDTIMNGEWDIPSQRNLVLTFKTTSQDSIIFYGSLITSSPVSVLWNGVSSWDSLSRDSSGGLWRYIVRKRVANNRNVNISIKSQQGNSFSVKAIALLGAELKDSLDTLTSGVRLQEFQIISNGSRNLPPGGFQWISVSVYNGDSIFGAIDASDSISASMITDAQFHEFQNEGTLPNEYLFHRDSLGDTLMSGIEVDADWVYLNYNTSNSEIQFSDSVVVYRELSASN